MRQAHLLSVGAAVLDTLFRMREMPTGQGKFLPYEMLQIAEGMASSAAYAAVRLGGRASLWGAVGDDDTGARILAGLAEAGIETDGMVTVPGARSAVSTILVDDAGERMIVPFYDQRLHETPRTFAPADLAGFDAALVDVRWPDLALEVLQAFRQAGKPAILDGDVAPDGVIERLGPSASHIIFSQPAAARLAGTDSADLAVTLLRRRFPEAFVCVTTGEAGSFWYDAEAHEVRHMPTLTVTAVDTLAAGDIFHGAFALAIAEGQPAEAALRLASVAAALKCTVFGGRLGAPTRATVDAVLARPDGALPSRRA